MTLEGRNDGIKMQVSYYARSLKPEELIDWLNDLENFFEWKPMTEEKNMKFACTNLKGHSKICVKKYRIKKGKDKIRTKNKMAKKLQEFVFVCPMHIPFFRKFQKLNKNYLSWRNSNMIFISCPFVWITRKLMSNWLQGM